MRDFNAMTNEELAAWLDDPLLAHQTHPYDEWKAAITAIRDRLRGAAPEVSTGNYHCATCGTRFSITPAFDRAACPMCVRMVPRATPGEETSDG